MPRMRMRHGEPPVAALPEGKLKLPKPPAGYAPVLKDDVAIARYIVDQAPGYIDEEMVEEYYGGGKASLRFVPIGELTEGNADGHLRSAAKERRYAKMPAATRPPLVIYNGEIEDGNHRYRVALAAGEPGLWCYDVEYPD
jgi:hypothetical protein